jgi:hypothetical protein
VIALWLGHNVRRDTQIYLHVDIELNGKSDGEHSAGRRLTAPPLPDKDLLAFLEQL